MSDVSGIVDLERDNTAIAQKIHIVDDDAAIRAMLTELASEVGLAATAYATGEAFLAEADFDCPSCVILDVRLPDMSGVEVQLKLLELPHPPPIIVISGHADVQTAVETMRRGALYLLEKPFRTQQMLDLIQLALRDDRAAWAERAKRERAQEVFALLSPRELEVTESVVNGVSSKVIASQLGISVQAVDGHRRRAMAKLETESVPDLVRLASQRRRGSSGAS